MLFFFNSIRNETLEAKNSCIIFSSKLNDAYLHVLKVDLLLSIGNLLSFVHVPDGKIQFSFSGLKNLIHHHLEIPVNPKKMPKISKESIRETELSLNNFWKSQSAVTVFSKKYQNLTTNVLWPQRTRKASVRI